MADPVTMSDISGLAADHADIRRETALGFGDTRYNIAERAGDIRREVAMGFDKIGDTVLQSSADQRRENAIGFGDTRYNIADQVGNARREAATNTDTLNDAIRIEGANSRAQSAAQAADIVKEGLKGTYENAMSIKDSRYEVVGRVEANADRLEKGITDSNFNLSSRVENANDRITKDVSDLRVNVGDRFFTVGRDLAQLAASQMAGFVAAGKDTELAALRTQIEAQRNTAYLSDKIATEGDRTRGLIHDLTTAEMNRKLIERNADISHHIHEGHSWHRHYDDARWGQHQNMLQGFSSQMASQMAMMNSSLNENRQSFANFGTLVGGQTSSANTVR